MGVVPSFSLVVMSIELRIGLVIALLAIAALAGLIWKLTTGRARKVSSDERVDFAQLGIIKNGKPVTQLTTKVTFLQFSSDFCTLCGPTAKMFQALETSDPTVTHLELNITNRLDIANKFNVLQTPTTLVLDRHGFIKSRIGGAPKAATLVSEIGNFDI
jgi:thiol-disulfide isomerase/thioredoxin